jgi:hypothetical protein
MNAKIQNELNHEPSQNQRRSGMVSGIILIVLGAIWLLNEFINFDIGSLFLPALGLVFLVWGILTRSAGLLIPGGVLGGIGAGSLMMNVLHLGGQLEAGVFLLAFGGGFALITLLSAIFTPETMWWALWPAGALAFIGGALFLGEPALDVLSFIGKYWPVVLIVIGVAILLRRR